MKNIKKIAMNYFRLFFVCALSINIISFAFAVASEESPRKIIVFQEAFRDRLEQIRLARGAGAAIIKPLPLINGLAAYLPPQAEMALSTRTEVLRIDDDLAVKALGKPKPPQPSEQLPWGVDRINAELAWPTTTGLAVKVAIVDTGINLDHPDLQANIKGNVNTINPRKSGNDDNGHGTHVAGIVAAADNEIGVIGVGPEIYLYAVKVLDRNGSGWLSDVIEGLDWCANNNMQVVNMSLGSDGDNQSFHDAIMRVYQAGIVQVAAAGNDGGTVDFPAAYAEAIAVSAIDAGGNIASWSSRGPEVDLTAPGVSIYSTYNDAYYKTLSGTSMAAPHVAGAAALVLSTPPGAYDLNSNGIWDPAEVQNKLEGTAEDFGLAGRDDLYGSGLVRADLATQ